MFGHAAFSDAPFGDIETSIFITASLSKDLNFTKTTTGAILFVTIDAGATRELDRKNTFRRYMDR